MILGTSIPDVFFKRVAATPDKVAILHKREGAWRQVTWRDYAARVLQIAKALKAEGVGPGDRVAVLSQTRPEWAYVDIATMCLGAVTVPIYPSVTGDDVHYILRDSSAKVIVAENSVQINKVMPLIEGLGGTLKVVSLDRSSTPTVPVLDDWLASKNAVAADETLRSELKALAAKIPGDSSASIVYTSGTTGAPKGADLTHANFLNVMGDVGQALEFKDTDLTLLFLPVAHILGRVEQMLTLSVGWTNAYAESLGAISENMQEVKPTVLVSVPRIYEKIYATVQKKVNSAPPAQAFIVRRCIDVGREYARELMQGRKPGLLLQARFAIADKLFYSKIRATLGGRLKMSISGGAPLPPEIGEFLSACGLQIYEGYGLTETCGPACVNLPSARKLNSVGPVVPNCKVKIAPDGEILLSGRSVFRGYWNNPEATKELLQDGWFATGDIGVLDEQGFLTITDRKKDLIVLSGGKNIAPQKIEGAIKADPVFANALVMGDREKFLGALVTLSLPEARDAAKAAGIEARTIEELAASDAFKKVLRKRLDKINAKLAPFEQIKRFRILPRDFTIEAGELTPSLKVKRKFCAQKYAADVQQLFD